MKHSIASVSLSGTLTEKLHAIAKAGFEGIEIFENDFTIANLSPTDLRKMVEDLGLKIMAWQPFRDYEALPNALKTKNLDRAERKFDLMQAIGTDMLFICSNTLPQTINNIDKAAEDLYDIAERARQRGFRIAYEALSWGKHVSTYHQSVEIVRRANHPNLGNLLDNFHISVVGSSLEELAFIPSEKIFAVQVADAPKFDMGAMYLGRHYRCFPGQGAYPVVEFMQQIRKTGFDGWLSHEIFSDEFRASQIDPVALDGKRSLVWLEGITTIKNTEGGKKTQNDAQNVPQRQVVAHLNPVNLTAIEFIEFATNAEKEADLINILTNLGFIETLKHKTRDVSIYQLGKVNIVLNRQKHAHANQYFEEHGNGVCAIGLVYDNNSQFSLLNSQDTLPQYWAEKLAYDWVKSTANKQELTIDAVKGYGDVLYYFVEATNLEKPFYEIEFLPTDTPKNDNGIHQIDHIGHTVEADLFLSNTLFHRAMLGLEIEESLEILDPRGIVYSRVAKNKSKTIRIPLSSTRARGTSSDHFIAKSGGAGIQQIALQTHDIFKTAESLTDKTAVLPIPSNYYDDLIAKTDLPLTTIEKMQALNIFFDRNTEGSFFHFYLKEVNGLFFEVVQRTGKYDRYGEVNAQVRLASQARDRFLS